jgi:hypothetical protein
LSPDRRSTQELRRRVFSGGLDRPHEITDRIDLIGGDVRELEARKLIFDRDDDLEAIEPIGAEIVAKARFVGHTLGIDAEMPGDDFADFEGDVARHGRSS